jgi:hypothetical protein
MYMLTRILREGFGFYGQTGQAGWTIARGFVAIAMDQGGIVQDATPVCSHKKRTGQSITS